jgi:hypothetical protein
MIFSQAMSDIVFMKYDMWTTWRRWWHATARAKVCRTLILLAPIVLAGCMIVREARVPVTVVDFPTGMTLPYVAAWLPTDRIVVGGSQGIWYRAPEASTWQQLPPPSAALCPNPIEYVQPRALPDGRLGFLCGHDTGEMKMKYVLLAYDWSTGQMEQLVPDSFPAAGSFAWQPDMRRGIMAAGNGRAYSTLYWLTARGAEVVDITLEDGGQSWPLPMSVVALEQYNRSRNRTGQEPHPVGMVRDPVWSPDGRHIAFWATLETIGHPYNFPVVPWDVYLMDAETLTTERILEDVHDPSALSWSPDGEWLTYVAERGNNRPRGLWLFSPRSRTDTLIQRGKFHGATWSPDGTSILAVHCSDIPCDDAELRQYDVNKLVAPPAEEAP